MQTALVTGASRGLGLALARSLAADGYRLVLDARGADALARAARELGRATEVHAVAGDVADPAHREALARAVGERLDVVVNNASELGPSPLPALADLDAEAFRRVLDVDVVAPLALIRLLLPRLAPGARIVNLSSDAAVEAYPGWGAYGAAKAALDHATAVLAEEHPDLRVYAVDPGDMRTGMHQAAFPGEDISDRPPPEASVPGLRALIDGGRASGRYRARDLAEVAA